MDNYHYIVASLPLLTPQYRFEGTDPAALLEEIVGQCGKKDRAAIERLRAGFVPENLTADFYRAALKDANPFLRAYFALDLRNAQVRFLNRSLGRDPRQDVVDLTDPDTLVDPLPDDFDRASELEAILATEDLLERERALDRFRWEEIDALVLLHDFDLQTLLAFVAKMQIVQRWYALDEETGRALLRELTAQLRGTWGEIKQ